MSQEPRSGSWWLTLPGVLTGLAAVITAGTGLAVALHQISAPSGLEKASSEKPTADTAQNNSRPPPASSDTTTSQTQSSNGATQQSLALPAGNEAKLAWGGGGVVFKILSARLEPYNAENRALRLTIRCTNNDGVAFGFWGDDIFRLLVDDVPRTPSNHSVSETVEAHSAKEGDVVFEVPTTENNVVLQISVLDDKTTIPFDLTATES